MAENIDNGYETDNAYEDHEHDILEAQTLLVQNYILETIKCNPDIDYIRQLVNQFIEHNIITLNNPNQTTFDEFYLHSPYLDDKMYSYLSPQITKEEYDILDSLYPCIKEPDYGSKFINAIKFYTHCIIIILPHKILKIDRNNDVNEALPVLTVYESGNIIILEWNHSISFGRDITKLSKLVFRSNGVITDMYWTNLDGVEYREDLLPSHIALRPNRFNNCWYLEYNSKLSLQDQNDECVNFTIHCCDS